jgi:hypothetical protein
VARARYSCWSFDCSRPNRPIGSTTVPGNAHADPYLNVHSNRCADGYINGNAYADRHSHACTEPHADGQRQPNSHSDANENGDQDSDGDPYENEDADVYTYTHVNADRKAGQASEKDSVIIAATVPPGDVQ